MLSLRENATIFIAAVVALVFSSLAVAGAFYFQFVLHLPPCPLCLIQRWPFYAAIPLSMSTVWLLRSNLAPTFIPRAILMIMAISFFIGACVAGFHAGVEWHFWAGLESCSGSLVVSNSADTFLQRLETIQIARCDEAPWRFIGLSIAGWNALLSLGLSAITLWSSLVPNTNDIATIDVTVP